MRYKLFRSTGSDPKSTPRYEELSAYITLPVTFAGRLDETLDSATVSLLYQREDPLPAFSRFLLCAESPDGTISEFYMVLDHDTVDVEVPGKAYMHVLHLVEGTKLLEREKCDNLAFTNKLYDDTDAATAEPSVTVQEIAGIYGTDGYQCFEPICSAEIRAVYHPCMQIPCIFFDGTTVENATYGMTGIRTFYENACIELVDTDGKHIPIENAIPAECDGPYTLWVSEDRTFPGAGGSVMRLTLTLTASVRIEKPAEGFGYTYADVVTRLLRCYRAHDRGTERFDYQFEVPEGFPNTPAPEFVFTGATLFEALLQIGANIHGIPYLKNWNTVSYLLLDRIGSVSGGHWFADDIRSGSAEGRADCFTTDVQHALMTDPKRAGSTVCEPMPHAGKSLRAENGSITIDNDSVCIPTALPIHSLQTLYLNGKNRTTQVLEKAAYDLLPATAEPARQSRSNTLYYVTGEAGIHGLCFRREARDFLDALGINAALVNVLGSEQVTSFANVSYNVCYTPYVDATLRQYRGQLPQASAGALTYNQGADIVDLSSLGTHAQSVISRSGNPTKKEIRYCKVLSEIPPIGARCGRLYASEIAWEGYSGYIKATVTWSEDFNRICERVAIDSSIRQFEISERECFRRNIGIHDLLCISTDPEAAGRGTSRYSGWSLDRIMAAWSRSADAVWDRPSCAVVQCFNQTDSEAVKLGRQVLLPVSCYPYGLSIAAYWTMQDNYAAGSESVESPFAEAARYRLQKAVPYADSFGRAEYLRFVLCTGDILPNPEQNGTDASHQYPRYPYSLPESDKIAVDRWHGVAGRSYEREILLQKDSRECISCTTQLHIVSDSSTVRIGHAATEALPYFGTRSVIRWVALREEPSIYGGISEIVGPDVRADFVKLPNGGYRITLNDSAADGGTVYPDCAGYAMLVNGELAFFVRGRKTLTSENLASIALYACILPQNR